MRYPGGSAKLRGVQSLLGSSGLNFRSCHDGVHADHHICNNANGSSAILHTDGEDRACKHARMDEYQELARAFLEAALNKTGLTPSVLAKRLGHAASTLTRLRSGAEVKSLMSLRVAYDISRYAGVPLPQVTTTRDPQVAEVLQDRYEVAWLRFWRRLEPDERRLMFRTHRIDPPADVADRETADLTHRDLRVISKP